MKTPVEIGKIAFMATLPDVGGLLADGFWEHMPPELRRPWIEAAVAVRSATMVEIEDYLRVEAAKAGAGATGNSERVLLRAANDVACGLF